MTTPIEDLALLSDCRSAALVARDGTLVWWPVPRFDSASAFSALLDDDAGHWSIRACGRCDSERRYLDGTLVLETTMRAAGGTLRLTDALAFAPGSRGHELGAGVPHALARTVEVLGGEVELEVELVPRLEYGLAFPRVIEAGGGLATLGGPERLFLRGDRPLEPDGGCARACFALRAGERAGWSCIARRAPTRARPTRSIRTRRSRTPSKRGARGRTCTAATRASTPSACASPAASCRR